MIFVTGGTGMLGAYLLYYLTQSNSEIVAIKRKSSNFKIIKNVFNALSKTPEADLNKITWREADLNDYNSIRKAMAGCKYVYHAAAFVSFDRRDKEKMLWNNINGTANVVNAALELRIEKFCHVSSIAALGESIDNETVTEDTKRSSGHKNSNYSQSKYKSELEVWRGINEGLKAVIVNPSVILGIGDWNKGSAAMFSKVKSGLKFYTHGGTGFVDARDVSMAMIKLMQSNAVNERYIINSENLSYREVFDLIAESINKPKASVFANKFLSEFAWRFEALRCYLLKTKPLLTKETVEAAHSVKKFSNKKIRKVISMNFIKIRETIQFMSIFFQLSNKR